jgi:hypothetical protein
MYLCIIEDLYGLSQIWKQFLKSYIFLSNLHAFNFDLREDLQFIEHSLNILFLYLFYCLRINQIILLLLVFHFMRGSYFVIKFKLIETFHLEETCWRAMCCLIYSLSFSSQKHKFMSHFWLKFWQLLHKKGSYLVDWQFPLVYRLSTS